MKRDKDSRNLLAHRKAPYKTLETLEPEKRVKAPSKSLMYQQEI